MKPTEPGPPQEGSAASDDQTLSWEVSWRPTTVPLSQEPAPGTSSPLPSGFMPSQPAFAPSPTEPRYRNRQSSGCLLLLTLVLGIALGAAGAIAAQSWLSTIQPNGDPTPVSSPVPRVTPSLAFSPTASPQPTPTSTPALSPTPTGPPWTTVQRFSGSGTTNTLPTTVPKSWRIAWQCNPASSPAGQYELAITLHTTNGKVVETTLDTTCKPTNTAGNDPQYQAGTFYLQIHSTADWIIQIQVLR